MKRLNRIGRFLSTLVFQNISGLIALGIIRILFGPTGWWPHQEIYPIIDSLVKYFIPILFAYTGGKMTGGQRGGIMASFVTLGLIAGSTSSSPMILPALTIGPFVGYVIAKLDKWLESKIPIGFELLLYNAAAGFTGVGLTILCYVFIGPLFIKGMHWVFAETERLVESGYLPLAALVIEPAKVLFFNNVINHGILEPIGIQQTKYVGKSIFFLLESNPGPGFGLLFAYYLRAAAKEKGTVKSSLVIHVLGGIHEVYFPYALMKPLVIIPLILGGLTGDFIFYLLKAGLVATPSPGSIFVLLIMAPKNSILPIIAGFIGSAIICFLGSLYVLSRDKVKADEIPAQSTEAALHSAPKEEDKSDQKRKKRVNHIVFACDAGMGSSAMGAALLRKKLKQANLSITVTNSSVDDIPPEADIVISQAHLTERAKASAPDAEHVPITSYVDQTFYETLITELTSLVTKGGEEQSLPGEISGLTCGHILFKAEARDKWEAIEQVGRLLVEQNHVDPLYIDEMKKREQLLSTYIGNGVAVPHGIDADSSRIKRPGISIAQYPNGVEFGNGNTAYILIAIAGKGSQQLSILSHLAYIIEKDEKISKLIHSNSCEEIVRIINDSMMVNKNISS
ncbi:PTS sugar transporter subunit IIA [Aneurinibacillus terranovensis]|uniref:PTS sugar transporter subunit IIA n=1 Tax=Aneurinibacillus terranovensis TaxID=278991 RepID=UPI0004162D4E|nr:PTS sugar transporter subunit IIA [Aneurinibacillus terranovensis]